MGVLFSFLQADEEETAQELIKWLKEIDRLPTNDFKPGRTPTYAELRQAIDQMEGYKIEYRVTEKHWDVWIETPSGDIALLCSVGVDGQWTNYEHVLSNVYWKNAIDVMLPISQKLANVCGTITIMNDSDAEDLIFVFPDQSE